MELNQWLPSWWRDAVGGLYTSPAERPLSQKPLYTGYLKGNANAFFSFFFSLITIFIFFFLYVFCFCEITLSLHCIFSLYTVLVLFSSFSLPFLSFLLQVLVLSTFTRSYHHFYLFSFLFFWSLSSYLFGPLCLFVFFFLLSYCCNFFVYPLLVRS